MTAKVLGFPSPAVIRAVSVLERRLSPSPEVERACTVLLSAISAGEPLPSWGVRLILLRLLDDDADEPFKERLARALGAVGGVEVQAVAVGMEARGRHDLAELLRGPGEEGGR